MRLVIHLAAGGYVAPADVARLTPLGHPTIKLQRRIPGWHHGAPARNQDPRHRARSACGVLIPTSTQDPEQRSEGVSGSFNRGQRAESRRGGLVGVQYSILRTCGLLV